MERHLQTDWLSSLFTTSVSYPDVPIHYRSSILSSYPSFKRQECWLPKSTQSDHNFKKGLKFNDNTDWKTCDKNNQMSIYNAFLVFTECMHLSLEKKLARNFNTLDEVIYYAIPYWNKLSNDEKKDWIRRAEAEKCTRRDIQVIKYRDKIKLLMKQFDNDAESKSNLDKFPFESFQHAHIREEKIDDRKISNINQPFSDLSKKRNNSTSGESEKQFLKKKSVSIVLPQQSIRRQKEQNALIKIFKTYDQFPGKDAIKNDMNLLSNPACWWSYLNNYNREIDSRHSSRQLIKLSNIDFPLRIKEELIWNDDHKSDNDTSCQSIIPISQL